MHTVPSVRITAHAGTNGDAPDSLFTAIDVAGDYLVAGQLWVIIGVCALVCTYVFLDHLAWKRFKRNRWEQFEAWMNRKKKG